MKWIIAMFVVLTFGVLAMAGEREPVETGEESVTDVEDFGWARCATGACGEGQARD